MKTKISIITVNYKQLELTADFLRSVTAHASDMNLEVIVVDNGSKVDNREFFRQVYPEVIYVRSEINLGFAGGNNLGVRYTDGDYLLFLNNDTEITQGLIPTMRDELDRNPEIGLLSPLILYFEGNRKIQYAGYTPMNYFTGQNRSVGLMEDNHGQYDQLTIETGYCHGAAMMCRRSGLEQAGLMEENYFLYYEELDWCEKFKRAEFKIYFTGKARIYHKESMSVGKESPLKTYFMVRNRWLFIRKNVKKYKAFVFGCYYVFLAIPFLLVKCLIKARFDLANAAIRGIWWNLSHPVDCQDLGIKLPDV